MAGGPVDVQRGIERYFAAGCTRVVLASWPRDARYVRRLLGTLGAEKAVAS